MKPIDIDEIRNKLERQRQESLQLLSQMGKESRAIEVDSPLDRADQCEIDSSKEALFERSSQQRTILRLIEAALRRIDHGSFGICVGCGDDIQIRRLEALPWTQFCLRCQEEIEKEVRENVRGHAPMPSEWRRAG